MNMANKFFVFLTGFILCFKNLPWCSTLFYSIISFTAGISCSQWRNNSSKKRLLFSLSDQKKRLPEAVVCSCSVTNVFLELSQNSQENTYAGVSFLLKLQAWGLRPATLWKKRLWYRCFPVNFVKFLRTPFSIKHLRWLLLDYSLSSYLLRTHKKNHTCVTNSQYATWLLNKYSCL